MWVSKALKSRDFLRVRIGISPETSGGKLKKPQGEKQVVDFVLGEFKPTERDVLKKERAKVKEIIETFVKEGHEQAMNKFN
jgi:peptidyl-tRNA hydrolase